MGYGCCHCVRSRVMERCFGRVLGGCVCGTVGAQGGSDPAMKRLAFVPFAALSIFVVGCVEAPSEPAAASAAAEDDRAPIGKADQTGSCQTAEDNFCGGQSDGNCWCDDLCEDFGDCCGDKPVACDGEEPQFCAEGTIEAVTAFTDASDGKQCAGEELHCVTDDHGACPQFAPLPPDFCADGERVTGPTRYTTSADGMECVLPSVHCLTLDLDACPLFQPLPPDFCSDGVAMKGEPSFIPSADGKECRIPSVHCVTTDANACESGEPEECEGELVVETTFTANSDRFQCEDSVSHCLTDDLGQCPQFAPLPPDFCSEGNIVVGPNSYIPSGDGLECAIPSVHCVTPDFGACPQFSPLPPNFCSSGEVVQGESSFIPSTDGMECEMPSVHCVTECG